jgi:hypothetical protein
LCSTLHLFKIHVVLSSSSCEWHILFFLYFLCSVLLDDRHFCWFLFDSDLRSLLLLFFGFFWCSSWFLLWNFNFRLNLSRSACFLWSRSLLLDNFCNGLLLLRLFFGLIDPCFSLRTILIPIFAIVVSISKFRVLTKFNGKKLVIKVHTFCRMPPCSDRKEPSK